MKESTQKLLGDIVGDIVELSSKVRKMEGFLATELGYETRSTTGYGDTIARVHRVANGAEDQGASADPAPRVFKMDEPPPAGRHVEDRYGSVWLVTTTTEALPLPQGLRGEVVLPVLTLVDPDPIQAMAPSRTWPMLLAELGPVTLVPLTPTELADEVLYGPIGGRWGDPNTRCPHVGIQGGGGHTSYRSCVLGVGHTGPHLDADREPLGATEPSGLTTDGAVTVDDLATLCTCRRPDQHQPGCPRYARVAGNVRIAVDAWWCGSDDGDGTVCTRPEGHDGPHGEGPF